MTAPAPNQPTSPLARPVTTLAGVGPERAAQLARLEILTVEDLLLHRPLRHEDRRNSLPISRLQLDQPATTRGKVVAHGVKWYQKHTKSIYELILDDGTARLHCRWWNLPFMEKYFATGDDVVVFGKPLSLKPRTMDHPETEVVEDGEEDFMHFNRLTPVYPLTEGLPQRWLRSLIWRTLGQFEPQISDPRPQVHRLPVAAPGVQTSKALVEEKGLPAVGCLSLGTVFPPRARAIHMLHFPEAEADVELARRRLALDEFITLQRQILLRRRNFETKAQALPCSGDIHLIKPFLARLGFTLMQAQA